jgi:hypothetical protein
MRAISAKIKKILLADEHMKKCVLCESSSVQFHHVFIYSGRQIDEAWAISPLCQQCHKKAHSDRYIKAIVENNALSKTTEEDLKKYPRKDWKQLIKRNEYEKNKHKTVIG